MNRGKAMVQMGLVGAGDWGKNIVRNLFELPGTQLKACCDVDPKALAFIREHYPGVELFEELDSFLSGGGFDAVVISSPAGTHYPIAKRVLEAGFHLFVEKPLALSSREAAELKGFARQRGRVLMVGHLMHYHPGVLWIRRCLREERLGRIFYLSATRSNLGRAGSPESVLWSLGPHDISLFLDFLGSMPLSVQARGGSFDQEGMEDVIFGILVFPQGILGHIHLSRLTPHKIRQVSLVGSRALIFFDDMESRDKIRVFHRGKREDLSYDSYGEAISLRFGPISLPRIEMVEPLRVECEHFALCVAENREPETGALEGERVVRVLEALERSLRNGAQPVAL